MGSAVCKRACVERSGRMFVIQARVGRPRRSEISRNARRRESIRRLIARSKPLTNTTAEEIMYVGDELQTEGGHEQRELTYDWSAFAAYECGNFATRGAAEARRIVQSAWRSEEGNINKIYKRKEINEVARNTPVDGADRSLIWLKKNSLVLPVIRQIF